MAEIKDLPAGSPVSDTDEVLMYLYGAATQKSRRVTRATLLSGVARTGQAAAFTTLSASTSVSAPSGSIDTLTTSRINIGAGVTRILSASATISIPTASAGAQVSVTMTVTGALTGDVASIHLPSDLPAGLICRAVVTAADTVTVYAFNATSGSISGADYAARAVVMRFA